jgi:hypothetical protein
MYYPLLFNLQLSEGIVEKKELLRFLPTLNSLRHYLITTIYISKYQESY